MRVLTCGTFDLFHIGHLNILEAGKALGTLLVGVSTDELVETYKEHKPIIPFEQRIRIVRSLKCVDWAFPQYNLDKTELIKRLNIDILVVGDDWWGRWVDLSSVNVEVLFFPYTQKISTTEIIQEIRKQ